jgi:hypothetical protein
MKSKYHMTKEELAGHLGDYEWACQTRTLCRPHHFEDMREWHDRLRRWCAEYKYDWAEICDTSDQMWEERRKRMEATK